MRGKTGKLAKSEEQILEVWAEHLESLGTPEAHPLQDSQFRERVSIQHAHCALLSPLLPQAEGLASHALDRPFNDAEIVAGIEALALQGAG